MCSTTTLAIEVSGVPEAGCRCWWQAELIDVTIEGSVPANLLPDGFTIPNSRFTGHDTVKQPIPDLQITYRIPSKPSPMQTQDLSLVRWAIPPTNPGTPCGQLMEVLCRGRWLLCDRQEHEVGAALSFSHIHDRTETKHVSKDSRWMSSTLRSPTPAGTATFQDLASTSWELICTEPLILNNLRDWLAADLASRSEFFDKHVLTRSPGCVFLMASLCIGSTDGEMSVVYLGPPSCSAALRQQLVAADRKLGEGGCLATEKKSRRLRLLEDRRAASIEYLIREEILIRDCLVGTVIGKTGENLSRVSRQHKVEIRVYPEENGHRRLRIYGQDPQRIQQAVDELAYHYLEIPIPTDDPGAFEFLDWLNHDKNASKELPMRLQLHSVWTDWSAPSLIICGLKAAIVEYIYTAVRAYLHQLRMRSPPDPRHVSDGYLGAPGKGEYPGAPLRGPTVVAGGAQLRRPQRLTNMPNTGLPSLPLRNPRTDRSCPWPQSSRMPGGNRVPGRRC